MRLNGSLGSLEMRLNSGLCRFKMRLDGRCCCVNVWLSGGLGGLYVALFDSVSKP